MKIVLTGSSSGIGRFLAESLAKRGHEICGIARTADGRGNLSCDVADWEALRVCARQIEQRWGGLDALICCAGIQEPIGPAMEVDPLAWRRNLAVNLDGTFFSIRAFHPLLQKASRRMKVICFSGGGAASPRPNFAAYAVAKAGVVRLVETLAWEWRGQPADINAVAPGAVFTRMTEQALASGPSRAGEKDFGSASQTPRDSTAALETVAELVDLLLSEQADGISGRLISARWDPWRRLAALRAELADSDIYTLRRIVPEDRGKNWER
jgi:3-oxoacyl-[acyl-carrier protein] reductase